MKNPNKVVVSLFVGMLTVSSVCSASMFSVGGLRSALGSIANSAETLAGVGRKVIDNPKKTTAAVAAGLVAYAGYKLWQDPWVVFLTIGDAIYSLKARCTSAIEAVNPFSLGEVNLELDESDLYPSEVNIPDNVESRKSSDEESSDLSWDFSESDIESDCELARAFENIVE